MRVHNMLHARLSGRGPTAYESRVQLAAPWDMPSFPSMPFARRKPTPLTPPWPHSQGIVPLPLDATQTASLIEEMKTSQDPKLLALLEHRVPPGVDEAPAARRPPFAAARRRPYPPGAKSGQAERQRG